MGASRQSGFTLIELMVVVGIMALLLALAVPSFESTINSGRLTGAANELVASIQTARMESVRRNRRAIVCLSANPNTAAPSCSTTNPTGWFTFLDANANGVFNPPSSPPLATDDVLLRTTVLKTPLKVAASTATAGKFIFRSDGLARDNTGGTLSTSTLLNGTVDVCIPTRRPSENVRHINVLFGSSVSVKPENTNAACGTPANPVP
jgi:type IV fimbrial biogenesis protein FimT